MKIAYQYLFGVINCLFTVILILFITWCDKFNKYILPQVHWEKPAGNKKTSETGFSEIGTRSGLQKSEWPIDDSRGTVPL